MLCTENSWPRLLRLKENVILARYLLSSVYSMSFAKRLKPSTLKGLQTCEETSEKILVHDIRLNENSHFRVRLYLRIIYRLRSLINWNILSGLETELAVRGPLRVDSEHHALYLRVRLPLFCNERYDFRFSVFKVHVYAPQTLRVSLHGRFLHGDQVLYLFLCGIYQYACRCERGHS